MKSEKDYIGDIAEIRSMMERSSKFLSLSGWAGVLAGLYALAGAFLAWRGFNISLHERWETDLAVMQVIILALVVLVLAVSTGIFLSGKNAKKRGEKLWNPITRRLAINMAVPLFTGGILILILIFRGWIGFAAPFSLVFYGLALVAASNFTYPEVRSLGVIEILLGVYSIIYMKYGLLCWAIGFGLLHIVYGIYMHNRYEK